MILTDNIRPRFSMLESYKGKDGLKVGMDILLRYNGNYARCKAVIEAVESDITTTNEGFDALDAQRRLKLVR